MDFLAATQLTVSNTWDKWKVRGTGALPWITAPPTVREASDELDRILATNFNPRAEMFVSGTTIRTNPVVTIREEKWLPEKISFRVSSAGPAVLAISQTFYPCWKAVVNGHPAPILRANHAFQAVEVPAGESLVELRYRDGWFRAGSIISFISALFVTILMLPERKRRASA
jgi:hypothetical protein